MPGAVRVQNMGEGVHARVGVHDVLGKVGNMAGMRV